MCGSVACRLLDDDFMKRLDFWHKELGEHFQTMLNGNCVACRLLDDEFMKRLDFWHKLLGKRFQTFVSGTASRLLDKDFVQVTDRWVKLLGISDVVTIFQRRSFVFRLMDVSGFEKKVFGHYILLSRNAAKLKCFLFKYKGKALDSAPWLEPTDSIAEISRTTEGENAQKQDAASAAIEKCAAAAAFKLRKRSMDVSKLTMHEICTLARYYFKTELWHYHAKKKAVVDAFSVFMAESPAVASIISSTGES
jgi:hypothetical protein